MIRWFGIKFRARMYDECAEIETPVGELCGWCNEAIEAGSNGMVIYSPRPELRPAYHRACFIRQTVGSLAHIERRCSCFVPGSTSGDPAGLTKRQAAVLAMTAFSALQWATLFQLADKETIQ